MDNMNLQANPGIDVKVTGTMCSCQKLPKIYSTVILTPYIKESENRLIQSNINKPNTKYVVKYNFTLANQTITIPEGCILDFDGGSFSNGTLVGNNTIIVSDLTEEQILININLEGTFIKKTRDEILKADEEDVTNANGIIKFKDKEAGNGMGKVILRNNFVEQYPSNTWMFTKIKGIVYLLYSYRGKVYAIYNADEYRGLVLKNNVVKETFTYHPENLPEIVGENYLTYTTESNVHTITLPDGSTITSTVLDATEMFMLDETEKVKVNLLTQSMINKENTIYVIKYDFELGGDSVTIPANCVLKFEGGSLNNGTIIGDETNIFGSKDCLNVLLKGSFVGTFDDIWLVFDDVASTKNYENVATLINNYHANVHWNGRYINLKTTDTIINLRPGIDYDFRGTTFICNNNVEDKSFFVLESIPIESAEVSIEALAASDLFTYRRGIIFAEDKTPLFTRPGFGYNYYRKDNLMVENNVLLDSPCLPYDDPDTELELKYIILDYSGTTIRNLCFERDGEKSIRFLYCNYQYNVTIENVSVDTLVDLNVMDEMFSINNTHTLNLKRISSSKVYKDGQTFTGSGYVFLLMFVTNLLCDRINAAASAWGVFGTRGINGAHIQNSTINRFDIHCYGKNILCTNCTFVKHYNQILCTTGYITFRNCTFINHSGLWIYDTPVSVFSIVTYDNCIFNGLESSRGHLIWLRCNKGENPTIRSLFSQVMLPYLIIKDCQLRYMSTPTNLMPLYKFNGDDWPSNSSDVNIKIDGLTVDYNNCKSYVIDYDPGISNLTLTLDNINCQNAPTNFTSTAKPVLRTYINTAFDSITTITARNSFLNLRDDNCTNAYYCNCKLVVEKNNYFLSAAKRFSNYINDVIYITPDSNNKITFEDGLFNKCRFKAIGPKENINYAYSIYTNGKANFRYCIFEDNSWTDGQRTSVSKCQFVQRDTALHFANSSKHNMHACVIDSYGITEDDVTNLISINWLISGKFYINGWKYYILNAEVSLEVYMRNLYDSSLNDIWTSNKTNLPGQQWYYTSRRKLVIGDGSEWRDSQGVVLYTLQSGPTSSRPKGDSIVVGFCYFDSDLGGKPIFAKEINGNNVTWVDATGQTV